MTTLATVLTHPHCRELKHYTQQLLDRAETAVDTAQWNAIKAAWAVAEAAGRLGTQIDTDDYAQDTAGHRGRHLTWLLTDAANRAHYFGSVETDLTALNTEIQLITVP